MNFIQASFLLALVALVTTAGRVDEHKSVKKTKDDSSSEIGEEVKHELTKTADEPPIPVKSLRPGGVPYIRTSSRRKSNYRHRRDICGHPSTLDSTQMLQSVVYHNNYRANEGAADVMKLVWDNELAARAQQWADQCLWRHGMLSDCSEESVGQNLYMVARGSTYPPVDMEAVIKAWFNEKPFYNYTSTTCQLGRMCGHYTQVVWGSSAEVGCAAAQCAEVNEGVTSPWYNALIVACDYRPAGNYRGEQPYARGPPCSRCHDNLNNIGYLCERDLCVDCDPGTKHGCSCIRRSCENGGVWNSEECTCDCQPGYYGRLCDGSCNCEDNSIYRAYCPSWRSYCLNPPYVAFMNDYCPKTCHTCSSPPSDSMC